MWKQIQSAMRKRKRIEVRFGPDQPRYIGFSRNLSRTGIMVSSMRVFAPGTLLNLHLKLPGETFELSGAVIWAREGPLQWLNMGRVGMGIAFLNPPPGLVETLQ